MRNSAILCASVALCALASPALGQTASGAAMAEDEASSKEAIVITGSRIVQNGNNMPTPVTVVTADVLTAVHPTNLAEALNDLPVFAGSRSQASNTGTSGAAGSPATSTNALNVINLRNMGLARTLILYDGHRAPPSTPEGFVDIDTIPQMLIKRVDVVTGGASAVYGSDAITGVVNFITDTEFKGIKANIQKGISTYGDAPTFEAGIAAGTDLFDGRGHFMASFNYRKDDGIDSKFARSWGNDVRTLQGDGTVALPYFQVTGARVNNATFGGLIRNGALIDQQFNSSGALVPFVHGVKTGQGGTIAAGQPYEIGGDGGYFNGQLRAALDLKQAYGRFDFDVADNVHFYVSAAYTANHSIGTGNWYSNTALTIGRNNAFLSPATVLAMGAAPSFSFGKIFTSIPRSEMEANATQFLTNVGLKGEIGSDWHWELAYVRGRGDFKVQQNTVINQGRFFAALDSVISGGVAVCRAALTNAAYSGCVPLNPFGTNSESAAAVSYITGSVNWTTKLHMDDFSGSISGSPFSTWAGPLSVAISGEWRRTSEEIISGSLPTARADCAGISFNCNANTQPYVAASGSGSVANLPLSSTTVGEGAIEVQVPLARDVPMLQSLDLNLAFRHAHYDRAGNANTWKAGLTWQPVEALTFRVTRSRDFRAPTIDELFRVQAFSLTNFTDVISGTAVATTNIATYNGGNPNLKPEIAENFTAGVVFKPASNFSIAIDYFNIKVKNFIFGAQGNNPDQQKACYDSKGSSPYCALITRGLGIYDPSNPLATSAANAVTAWYQVPGNVAEQSTYGADVEVNYRTSLFGRPTGLRLLTTWQPHVKFVQEGIKPDNDYGGVAFGTNGIQATPKWRVSAFLDFKATDNLTIGVLERWRSSLKYHSDPNKVTSSPNIKSYSVTNLNVAYDFDLGSTKAVMFVNVANLFNATPPQAGFWGNPNPGQFGEFVLGDDVIGRYFTIGARVKF
jgi:iron complex outermembrane receptor protein